MAYAFEWPATLPKYPEKGFTESIGVLVLRTPMDAGPAKQRRRGARPNTMGVQYIMTTAQVETLTSFVIDSLDGTARFGFLHPRTKVMVEARIVPQQGGELFTTQYLAPGYWSVSLQLEILP